MSRSEMGVEETQAVSRQWKQHIETVLEATKKKQGTLAALQAVNALVEEQSRQVNVARERASWLRLKLSALLNERAREVDAQLPVVKGFGAAFERRRAIAQVRLYRGRALEAQRSGDEVYR